jgi:pimeloyl-ACP methyl ester carboxylesterase
MNQMTQQAAPVGLPGARWGRRILGWLGRILLGLVVLVVALLALGAAYQAIATAIDGRKFPPPGQLYDVGGYRLHIYCTGKAQPGAPTVILDAHNGGTVSQWAWVQPEVAAQTRVCAYDRAGLGWSDQSPSMQDTTQNAEALHTLLQKAGVPGPYILVGHSFGGLYVRGYADRYPEEVAGMVLIEATNPGFLKVQGKPDVMPNANPGMMEMGPWASRVGLLRLAPFFRANPVLPEQQRLETDAYYSTTNFYETLRRQYHLFPTLLGQVRAMGDLGSRPLVVVLGSQGDGGRAELRALFEQQAALSSNSMIQMVDGADHITLVQQQEYGVQVARAILEVLEAVRTNQPLNP